MDIPTAVVAADMDADGRTDVLVAHAGWNRLGVYRQFPSHDFATEEVYSVPYGNQYDPQGLAVGDINSDGRPDAVLADFNNGLVVLRHVTDDTALALAVTSPVGGPYAMGAPVTVRWTLGDTVAIAGFDVSVSFDNGGTYAAIAGCTGLPATARQCAYTLSGPVSSTAIIRVTATDGTGQTAFSETTITMSSTLIVTAPAAGTTIYTDTGSLSVAWTTNVAPAVAPSVRVELSRDGGATFQTLAVTALNTGTYTTTVSGPGSANARVRVTTNGFIKVAGTSAPFTLVQATAALSAPAPGTTVYAGAPVPITWTSNLPATELVTIQLTRDGGSTYTTIAADLPNTGSFVWAATGPATGTARLVLAIRGPGFAMAVTGTFAIVVPSVTVSGPESGAAFYAGMTARDHVVDERASGVGRRRGESRRRRHVRDAGGCRAEHGQLRLGRHRARHRGGRRARDGDRPGGGERHERRVRDHDAVADRHRAGRRRAGVCRNAGDGHLDAQPSRRRSRDDRAQSG